jgi:hypothetical protein
VLWQVGSNIPLVLSGTDTDVSVEQIYFIFRDLAVVLRLEPDVPEKHTISMLMGCSAI